MYLALTASVEIRIGSPKTARNEQVCVVHLCCGLSLWRQMAPQQSAKFRTAFFCQFRPVWGWIASPIMHRF